MQEQLPDRGQARHRHRQLRLDSFVPHEHDQALLQVEGEGERGVLLGNAAGGQCLPLALQLRREALEVAAAQVLLVPVQGEGGDRVVLVAAAHQAGEAGPPARLDLRNVRSQALEGPSQRLLQVREELLRRKSPRHARPPLSATRMDSPMPFAP